MGVNYSGNYGVGVPVDFNNLYEVIAEKYEVDVDDADAYVLNYLEYILQGTDYDYFEVGAMVYSCHSNEIYIEIKDVFRDGYDITEKVINLIEFCEDNGITMVGEVGVVGGLEIY